MHDVHAWFPFIAAAFPIDDSGGTFVFEHGKERVRVCGIASVRDFARQLYGRNRNSVWITCKATRQLDFVREAPTIVHMERDFRGEPEGEPSEVGLAGHVASPSFPTPAERKACAQSYRIATEEVSTAAVGQ